jgi:hypothetical protein
MMRQIDDLIRFWWRELRQRTITPLQETEVAGVKRLAEIEPDPHRNAALLFDHLCRQR